MIFIFMCVEEGSATFFKFKEEQYDTTMNKNMMELNFRLFESTLENFDTIQLLGLKDEEDQALVYNILNEHPVVLDKPIVPSFSKSAKGYVLFKSQQPVKPNVISEENGIYIRNDRHIPTTTTPVKKEAVHDDLDELLALDSSSTPPTTTKIQPKKNILPKPGSIPKKKTEEVVVDDEAWLDDLLG